jgi:hypothetical protein
MSSSTIRKTIVFQSPRSSGKLPLLRFQFRARHEMEELRQSLGLTLQHYRTLHRLTVVFDYCNARNLHKLTVVFDFSLYFTYDFFQDKRASSISERTFTTQSLGPPAGRGGRAGLGRKKVPKEEKEW